MSNATGQYGVSETQQRPSLAGRGPRGYKRSDQRILEEVCDAISRSDEIDASDMSVEVKDAEVTLSGTVEERGWKHVAERIAENVPGVRDVTNHLRVKRAKETEEKREDTQTERAAGRETRATAGRHQANM
jgi:osmotically-inducible protein OsmY